MESIPDLLLLQLPQTSPEHSSQGLTVKLAHLALKVQCPDAFSSVVIVSETSPQSVNTEDHMKSLDIMRAL